MGKTADLTAVQKAIIDTLKQEGARVWRKTGVKEMPKCLKSSVKYPQSVMTCEDILIMGGKRILNPAVLFAEHREVHPELRPQGLQVFCDGICHRIRDLPFLLNEKF
ncbi:unnamed protein product [Boreogadus saida]